MKKWWIFFKIFYIHIYSFWIIFKNIKLKIKLKELKIQNSIISKLDLKDQY